MLWGSNSASAGAKPKYLSTANATATQGVTVAGAQAHTGGFTDPGWVQVRRGQGGVVSVTIAAGGNAYVNTDTVVFTANASGGTGAVAALTTDANGKIITVNVTTPGSAYMDPPVITITTSTGSGANLVAVLGGNAGRRINEVLVAMKSIT